MPDRVYLDWNATTPLRSEARQAMAAAWELAGNPSSVHAEGRQARRLVEKLKTQKGIVIDQQIIPGANHFFDGKLEPLMETVTGYLDMRLANVR